MLRSRAPDARGTSTAEESKSSTPGHPRDRSLRFVYYKRAQSRRCFTVKLVGAVENTYFVDASVKVGSECYWYLIVIGILCYYEEKWVTVMAVVLSRDHL